MLLTQPPTAPATAAAPAPADPPAGLQAAPVRAQAHCGGRFAPGACRWVRARRPGPTAATVLVLALVTLCRIVVQLRWGDVTGLDTGNWFTLGNALTGRPLPEGADSVYPPVVPVAVSLLGRVVGPFAVAVTLGAVGGLVHAGCAAIVLLRAGIGWWTPPLVAVLAAGNAVGEALAWGGFPQLIGLGVALLVLYLVAEMLTAPSYGTALTLGLVGLLLGATSHLVLAETAAVAAVMVALRLLSPVPRPTVPALRRAAAQWAVAATPSLLLVPLYLRLAATVGGSFADRRTEQTLADLLSAVDAVSRDAPQLWRPATVAAMLLPLVLYRHRRRPLWLVTAGFALVLGAVVIASPEPRFAYLVPLLVVCAAGLLASAVPLRGGTRPGRLALRTLALGLAATSVAGGLGLFPDQVRYYGQHAPRGTPAALDVLREVTDPTDVVLVPPVLGMPFGWWVEGYGRRPALVGSSSRWLNFPAERERARASVEMFSASDIFSSRWFAAARALDVDVVYVPATFDGVDAEATRRLLRVDPDLVLHRGPAALIVEVPRS